MEFPNNVIFLYVNCDSHLFGKDKHPF